MGTVITLEVGGIGLDWSKNSRGNDHGMLFQDKDRKRAPSDQIDYEYHYENNLDPAPMEMVFSRSLREVIPRIELLGFNSEQVAQEYEACAEEYLDQCRYMIEDDGEGELPNLFSFEEFQEFVTSHALNSLDGTYVEFDTEGKETLIQGRFANADAVRRLPYSYLADTNAYSEQTFFAGLIGILHPYSLLWLLAQNQTNLDADVVWEYGPLADAGWASESDFFPNARRAQTFLVATEGSSDTHILKHALSLLIPEAQDFFRFIDVSQRHPFSGTGNLLKFAEGLAKIDVQNQVVFVFDNDAEGSNAYKRFSEMQLPHNMRAMVLPELEEFRAFPARGPDGISKADINGRAAAIECYLDLELDNYPPANVIWTSYKQDLELFQGALEHKETYMRAFLKQTDETVGDGSYDVSKLRILLESLITLCSKVAIETRKSHIASDQHYERDY